MTEPPRPLVTIAIPNHNQGHFLAEAVKSVLAQTMDDYEILIINNAALRESRVETEELAAIHSKVFAHSFDELLWPIENWNRCLGLAKGQYFIILPPELLLKPDFLQTCLSIFKVQPELGYVWVEKEGPEPSFQNSGIIPGLEAARENFLKWNTDPAQVLMRTQCLRDVGGYYYSDVYPVLLMNMKWDVGYCNKVLVESRVNKRFITEEFIQNKTLVMHLFLSKIMVMDYYLPPKARALKDLKPQVKQQFAMDCLEKYCLEVLAENNLQLCREYLALARNFWLEVDSTPAYAFVEHACRQEDWTWETIHAAWKTFPGLEPSEQNTRPLPEGTIVLD